MNKARWIWYPGEYEILHSLLVHERRIEYGAKYPPNWGLPSLFPIVNFQKTVDFKTDTRFTVRVKGIGYLLVDGSRFPTDVSVPVKAGRHTLVVRVMNFRSLAAAFIDHEEAFTDGSWTAEHGDRERFAAGCVPAYTDPDADLERFPFVYREITPLAVTPTPAGVLYDFGKESFAALSISGLDDGEALGVFCGESREEALADESKCCVWENVCGKNASLSPRAFRYIELRGEKARAVTLTALSEDYPVPTKASFSSDDPVANEVWRVCADTFRLCSREVYLDAIKRDRWAWGGDARQSIMIGGFLVADRDVCRRTIIALFPKEAPVQHINNIVDYTMLMIIAVWEYYFTYGDADFVRFMWKRVKALYDFLHDRLDEETGFVVRRPGDWIFIDWAEIDKDGPLAAEQILLWQTENVMVKLCELLDRKEEIPLHTARADALKARIPKYFWDADKKAYIDTYASGKKHVSRHAAIFAILFDFASPDLQTVLYENVLQNDAVPPIVTPYFKLYELAALCKCGGLTQAQALIRSYWGGMLERGATSIWEQFDPSEPIPDCYAMYGGAFQKSLCHAWSCGPIYFLGRYLAGVEQTGVGFSSYTVAPDPGLYHRFRVTVPTEKGGITVEYDGKHVTVTADLPGGTLVWNGKTAVIPAGAPVTL